MPGSGTTEKLKDEFGLAQVVEPPKGGLLATVCNPYLTVILLLIVCALCFGRTLGSYFLADDIGEIRYVQQIFAGHWDLFWSNFCGNYMQVPNMSVYRPVLLLTLVFDFAVWKGNALGYYLSNLFYYAGSACFLALLVRRLCAHWGRLKAAACGLASALAFIVNPLHCESISWVVGRVDSACCMFYLASILSFLNSANSKRKWTWTIAGLLLFYAAIFTKEMAIGLAPTLTAIAFFLPETLNTNKAAAGSFVERIKTAFKFSSFSWYATGLYFLIRYLALGTLLGGYSGSVGAAQSAGALTHWLDLDNWHRLIFPLPLEIYGSNPALSLQLLAIYAGFGFLALMRLFAGSMPWRTLAFLAFWSLTQLAPIYRLFGLGFNLEGARFCFFFTLSLSTLLPVLVFAPANTLPARFANRLTVLGTLLLISMSWLLGHAAYACNLLWLHAGKEVRAVLKDAERLSAAYGATQKILLLGVPKEHAGAHMILNGSTLQMLLSPPFTKSESWQQFLTFDPILFGDETRISGSRLAQQLNEAGHHGPYVWSNRNKRFQEITLQKNNGASKTALNFLTGDSSKRLEEAALYPSSLGHAEYKAEAGGLRVTGIRDGDGFRLSKLKLNPLEYGYLKISFRSTNNKIRLPFQVRWRAAKGSDTLPELAERRQTGIVLPASPELNESDLRTVFIPLARDWRWYTQGEITELSVQLPAVESLLITDISLLPVEQLAPVLKASEPCNNIGVVPYSANLRFRYASRLGERIRIQLSKNQFFFDNLDMETSKDGIANEFVLSGKQGEFKLQKEKLYAKGYYQLRAQSLDSDGKPCGDFSDPLTIMLAE